MCKDESSFSLIQLSRKEDSPCPENPQMANVTLVMPNLGVPSQLGLLLVNDINIIMLY